MLEELIQQEEKSVRKRKRPQLLPERTSPNQHEGEHEMIGLRQLHEPHMSAREHAATHCPRFGRAPRVIAHEWDDEA